MGKLRDGTVISNTDSVSLYAKITKVENETEESSPRQQIYLSDTVNELKLTFWTQDIPKEQLFDDSAVGAVVKIDNARVVCICLLCCHLPVRIPFKRRKMGVNLVVCRKELR